MRYRVVSDEVIAQIGDVRLKYEIAAIRNNTDLVKPHEWPAVRKELIARMKIIMDKTPPEDVGFVVDVVAENCRGLVDTVALRHAWQEVWRRGRGLSPELKYWETYRLVLLGGACRIGRRAGNQSRDPIAAMLAFWQGATTYPFTHWLYPETDNRFWPLVEREHAAAAPYLFVAAGYTRPENDWPEIIKPTLAEPIPTRGNDVYGAAPGDPG